MNKYKLETLHIHLSRNCNLTCANCWIGSKPGIEPFSLPLNKIKAIVDESTDLGLKTIKLTGGEPFFYKYFCETLEFLVNTNLHIEIETNATIPFDRYLNLFTSFKDRIEFKISLDGHDQFSNSLQRGGDFDIIKNNIELLRKNNIKTGLITLITSNNFNDVENIVRLANRLKVNSHRLILNLNPSGSAKAHLSSSISINETFDLINRIKEFEFYDESRKKQPYLYTTLPAAFQLTEDKYFNTCFWGINLCTVLSNLNVAICGSGYNHSQLIAGNLNNDSLTNIWNNSDVFNKIRKNRNNNLRGICANCKFVADCRGLCRAQSVSVYDDVFAPYPFCQDAYNAGYFPEQYLTDPDEISNYYSNETVKCMQ